MQRSLSAGLVADGGAVYDAAEVSRMATPGLAVLGRQVATG
jgi:hypothetical protein